MRIFDQAAVDAVPRHANGRRYMPRGIYAAGVVTGDWCSFPEGCVFGRGCSIGRDCKFERCWCGAKIESVVVSILETTTRREARNEEKKR